MSVVNKFNQKAKEYDSERRALIPCFDDFYGVTIDCIDFKGDNPKVLDLGAFCLKNIQMQKLSLLTWLGKC